MQLPDAIDRIRRSVVQVQRAPPGGFPSTLGSGFLVGDPMHVVTAKHVVDAVDVSGGEAIVVGFALPDIDTTQMKVRGSFMATTAAVVDVWDEHDLSLLQVAGAGQMQPQVQIADRSVAAEPVSARLSTSRPRDGLPIAISGYPLSEPSLVTTSGTLATSFSLEPQPGPQTAERYLADITANPGNSGGPVYAVGDATVIGVCVGGRLTPIVGGRGAQTAGLTVIVRAIEVVALLDRNGVSSAPAVKAERARRDRHKSRRKR